MTVELMYEDWSRYTFSGGYGGISVPYDIQKQRIIEVCVTDDSGKKNFFVPRNREERVFRKVVEE